MAFVPDQPASAGRFVPDDEVMKVVRTGMKPESRREPKLPERPSTALMEGALNVGSGMLAKPISDIAGLAATGKEMVSPTPGGGDPAGFKRAIQEGLTYEPRTRGGAAVAQYNPAALLAKMFGWGGEKAEQLAAPPKTSGPARAAMGSGVRETVQQLPAFLGLKARPAAEAASRAARGTAEDLMQSALKPPLSDLKSGKAKRAIGTLLDEGVNVTRGGAEKLQNRIDVLNDRIEKTIASSPATIDKKIVGYYVQSAIDKFSNQVNKSKDLRAIQRSWDEFLNDTTIPDKIPVQRAQELKQGTYRALGQKSYGELKGAEIEAQKALARGFKEEIARAAPEVRSLNARESEFINALSLVERRALMEANKNPAGLGWLTTNPEQFAAWMADRSGLFKSLIARMVNTGGRTLPPLGATGPAMGVAASQDRAQLDRPPQ